MSRGASVISVSYFVPVWDAIWVIKVADRRSLLTREMWGVRMAYISIGRYLMSAAIKGGVNRSTSYSWRGYRNWVSRGGRARR